MPLPIPPLVAAFLLLGALAVAIVGRETLARVDHALGGATSTALAGGALAGAAGASEPVSMTLATRILLVDAASPAALVYALLAALGVAAGLHGAFPAGLGSLPFSGTQATVGALVGAGLAVAGPAILGVPALAATAAAWILVPATAALASRGLAGGLARRPLRAWAALAVPAALLLAAPLDPGWRPGAPAAAAVVAGLVAAAALARWAGPPAGRRGNLGATLALGLAVGASDAANVLGPTAAAVRVVDAGAAPALAGVPGDLRLLAAGTLVAGFAAWRPDELGGGGAGHREAVDEAGLVAVAGGAALPLALVTSLGIPASATAALLAAAAGARSRPGGGETPWRRLAAGALAWTLLAGLAAAFLAGFLTRVLV